MNSKCAYAISVSTVNNTEIQKSRFTKIYIEIAYGVIALQKFVRKQDITKIHSEIGYQ